MKLRARRQRGTVLILTGLFLLAAVAVVGMAFDLSRFLLISKGLQGKTEAAAVAAALELDGSPAGLARAAAAAGAYAGPDARVRFAETARGPWLDGGTGEGMLFARVDLGETVSMPLSRAATGRASLPARGWSSAGQAVVESWESGLYPYAVETAAELAPGQRYPLSYYEEPVARTARAAVSDGHQSARRKLGDRLPVTSAPSGEAAIAARERVRRDTDSDSVDYASYAAAGKGNGRRLIAVPVVDADRKMTGAAAFFLGADGAPDGAEFVGGYLAASRWRGAAAAGFHEVRLGRQP